MSEYGQVVLTLSNVLLPSEKLHPNPTPSMNEGLPWDVEYDLRLIGCELIQTACLLLKLPQTAVATGQVLFHRYFYSSSFVRRSMEITAMACTNLAAKIEEDARRVRDIINVFHHIKQVRSGSLIQPLPLDQVYIDRKNAVISAERRLLKELGFCVYVQHPHKIITLYLKVLEKEREKALVQTSWNYMNDSLRTDVFLRFNPETIACACIDLAARNLQIPLPKSPPWYLIFGAKSEAVRYIMFAILRLYKHRPKALEELEKIVDATREKRESERRRPRLVFTSDSPTAQPVEQAPSSTPPNTQPEGIPVHDVNVHHSNRAAAEAPTPHANDVKQKTSAMNNQRRKRRDARSRSSSRSSHRHRHHHHSQKRKKTSHRSRSRSRFSASSRTRRRHHSSRSSKDANNNVPQSLSKTANGVASLSSNRKVYLKE